MPKSQPKSQDQAKQVISVRGYTVVLKKTGNIKFAGIYSGMMGRIPKYVIQIKDFNDLILLKALINDKDALKEVLETIEKFLTGQ